MFHDQPGLLYVVATLLPLASFVVLLLMGGLRNATRRYREGGPGAAVYWFVGGDNPGRLGAYIATAAIGGSFLLCAYGLVRFVAEHPPGHDDHSHTAHAGEHHDDEKEADHDKTVEAEKPKAWADRLEWARIGYLEKDDRPAIKLELGYYIDHLSAIMFAMVTLVATLIHVFSIGYMSDELKPKVEDHQVHGEDGGHFTRNGRFGRFFMYLSLFCFSMLNLVLADNLFQVFVSWELVGVCSFLLIGFYYERTSASNAANKAFITNRIGDAGFILGMLIIWSFVGTFNFQGIFAQIRAPKTDSHGEPLKLASKIATANPVEDKPGVYKVTPTGAGGSHAVIYPAEPPGHYHPADANSTVNTTAEYQSNPNRPKYGAMPYWMFVAAGLGIFLGCVGKSAQFPLQVWLPDAMEGPTPVSALIHAATMVAAGVYLVGRCFPLFTPEARLVIAYGGAITLFVAATIAIVMNDIKKVLAYSTVSQLGYMMLALGIGGWVAGLMHLLTHAFFKALLFLGSGSVIHGCHHEQDMRKMGGLYPKMKITALTMLVGVLAIAGTPLFSGWYSKDAIVADALAFATIHRDHVLLLVLPLLTAGITCFYMFRMWFMTFAGKPKDHHVHEHAHESPGSMTVPLIVLAAFSLFVAWGWPVTDAEASYLGKLLHEAQPASVHADFAVEHAKAHDVHAMAGFLALGAAVLGAVFAAAVYYYKKLDPAEAKEQFAGLYRLFERKWYFDELYSALLVRPAMGIAHWCRRFDTNVIDRFIDNLAAWVVGLSRANGRFDKNVIDGAVNVAADATYAVGKSFRQVQTGALRQYVLFLVLALVGIFAALSYFISLAVASN